MSPIALFGYFFFTLLVILLHIMGSDFCFYGVCVCVHFSLLFFVSVLACFLENKKEALSWIGGGKG